MNLAPPRTRAPDLDATKNATGPDLKAAFFEYNRDVRIANSKIACMLVIVLVPVGVTLDYYVYPELTGFFLFLRFICSALAGVLWALLGTSFGYRHFRLLGMGWALLPSLFISLMIYFSEGATSPYYAGLNLVLIAVSWVAQVDFFESVITASLTLLMYALACIGHGGGSSSEYFNNFYFIVLTGVIVVTGSYFLNRLRFREYALRSELDGSRRELQESNAKLVELDRAKSAFFANVSHELRTPLTLLIAPLDRLRHRDSEASTHEERELLDIMYNNAMRLLRLINDLLDLVRLDSGTIQIKREEVELFPFLEGIAKSVSVVAEQRKLQFESRLSPETQTRVSMDRDKLEKVILNLLFNAFKFTPECGRVTLTATVREHQLVVSVRDTGVGIAPADLPRIFDRFWQAEPAATRRYQGVGIGLALAKELTEAHGGSISVKSKLGEGTCVEITAEILGEPHRELEPVREPAGIAGESEWLVQLYRRAEFFPAHVLAAPGQANDGLEGSDANRPSVLIADDEPEMRRFLVSQLKGIYSIREAHNGTEALALARDHDFVLILLDLMMPGIDGITLTRHLREESRTAAVPIIILTARADEDSKMQALEAGATDFLTKPFASSELSVRCRNLVLQQQLQQTLAARTRELEAALEQVKQTETQLVHQAKMASLGQLSAGLIHEINNPLNFANTAAFLIQKRLGKCSPEDREAMALPVKDLMDGIRRVSDIISSLRSFTHPDLSNFAVIPLLEIVEASARFVQLDSSEIELAINIPAQIKVWANRNQLIHLFINLLQNASDSLREKAAPEKKIKIEAALQNGRILLICEDNGKGIKTDDMNKVFDAFFTTKPVGSGVGLGLSISHRIVQNHRGDIRVESEPEQYCRFVISLHTQELKELT